MFSCGFCKIFKNSFFTEHLWTTVSAVFHLFYCFFATQWTNKNQVFHIFEHVLLHLSIMISCILRLENYNLPRYTENCPLWDCQKITPPKNCHPTLTLTQTLAQGGNFWGAIFQGQFSGHALQNKQRYFQTFIEIPRKTPVKESLNKLQARGLQLYWKETDEFSIIFKKPIS